MSERPCFYQQASIQQGSTCDSLTKQFYLVHFSENSVKILLQIIKFRQIEKHYKYIIFYRNYNQPSNLLFLLIVFLFQSILATEWCGVNEPLQPVFIQLHQDQVIKVVAASKSDSRTIRLQAVEVAHSDNARSKTIRLRIPKEFDLVRIQIYQRSNTSIELYSSFS